MSTEDDVKIGPLYLREAEAQALAQLVKRAGLADVRAVATDESEAYAMLTALEAVGEMLAEAGFRPR